jgi:transcriptional/translational regulatory protein YebC/TACO1
MEDFGAMVKKLEDMKLDVENAELQRKPNTTKALDEESMRKVLKIVDLLEDDDDVQAVYHDMEIPEDFDAE